MVYAKIIYLLMVVISGALCTVEDYVIMSQCAHNKAINLAAEGTVSVTDISQTQNITIVGRPDFVNNNFKIALYAKETQRYLCFNDHWKLIGMKELQDTCYFNEAIVHGYFVFRSVVDLQRRIGFTQRGRAVGPKKSVNDACYMFTKIPADQFFHQHTHFSTLKAKSTTTRKPKTEYTHTPYSTHVGRGSGGGRTKTTRNKIQHHQYKEDITHNHSGSGSGNGNGHGNGSGSGSGSGNGNGNGNKKFRRQRNGNKQRQQQQQLKQKQKEEMQQPVRGHTNNLKNPKNSTYLNSSRQNIVLSQHSINNHTNNKKPNNSNNNNNSNSKNNANNHPPQNHQVRHHHNDPNKIARRQQHDQKQKTKMRQRVRPSPSSSALKALTTKTASGTTATTPLRTAKAVNSTKLHCTQTCGYTGINPTSAVATLTTTAAVAAAAIDSHSTMPSTVVVTKRKGRRRKSDKLHKKDFLIHETEREKSSLATPYEEVYLTSPTDLTWTTNDIMFSSAKPTSASLPSWGTWNPSSSISNAEEDSDYFSVYSSSLATLTATETDTNKQLTTALQSSSTTDYHNNSNTLRAYVPLPTTSQLSTSLTDNSIDETISPTVTTDLGMTTTNTSTFNQTDFWSGSPSDNMDANKSTLSLDKESFNTYSTPQLENTQNILNTDEVLQKDEIPLSTHSDTENTTDVTALTSTEDNQNSGDIAVEVTSDFMNLTAEDTTSMIGFGSTMPIFSSSVSDQTSEAFTTTTTILTNNCTFCRNKSMTDNKLAAKTTENIANNHKHKTNETTSTQHSTQNYILSKMEVAKQATTSSFSNTITINYEKNTNLLQTTSTVPYSSMPSKLSKMLASGESLQHLNLERKSKKINVDPPRITKANDLSSTVLSTKTPMALPLTTRKSLRKSTQKLLATPFHQLTFLRNNAGDMNIDIDSIDNISIYPDLLDNDNNEPLVRSSASRLTMISGYLPTSATATLPESIQIAKIKINRERKRMLRLRNAGNFT